MRGMTKGVMRGTMKGMMNDRYHLSIEALFVASMASIVTILGLGGCQEPKPEPPAYQMVMLPPPPPEPQLRAVGDAQLTLFGEFPDRERTEFHSQAASPMKQHTFETEGAGFDVNLSPDGKTMVFASTRHYPYPKLYIKNVDGQAITQLTDDRCADVQPCFSPDGQHIAFASNRSGNWDIWIIALQDGRVTQVTHAPQHEVHPSFSPDGKQLAYCQFNERSQQWELWVVSLAQPNSRRMIGLGLFPQWSPRGDSIVYQRARERGGRWFSVWRIDLEPNGEPKFPIELAASSQMALIQPSWSIDGEWVTYGTAEVGAGGDGISDPGSLTMSRGDIWIVRADGSSPTQLTNGGGVNFGPVWSTDDRVYFTSRQNGLENIWSVRPMAKSAQPVVTAAVEPRPSGIPANVPVAIPAAATGQNTGPQHGG
ncbi:MAG: DPP IV N-terminal domain-containing protein [Phycisphaerae bacterium]|nr:DPP IV N-terminal domain-containing protein [Phycisphaerae bacterium]